MLDVTNDLLYCSDLREVYPVRGGNAPVFEWCGAGWYAFRSADRAWVPVGWEIRDAQAHCCRVGAEFDELLTKVAEVEARRRKVELAPLPTWSLSEKSASEWTARARWGIYTLYVTASVPAGHVHWGAYGSAPGMSVCGLAKDFSYAQHRAQCAAALRYAVHAMVPFDHWGWEFEGRSAVTYRGSTRVSVHYACWGAWYWQAGELSDFAFTPEELWAQLRSVLGD